MPASVFRRALLPVSDQQVLSSARAAHRVGWGFISLYTLAYMSTSLLFLAPVLVTLALKVISLVGSKQAPGELGAGRRRRRPGGHGRQSVLRPDERPHRLAAGHAAAVDGHRPGGRFRRHRNRRAGPQRPGPAGRVVHRPVVLQRAARHHGGGAAGPGSVRAARPGLRCAGCLLPHRLGLRHVPGQAVRRQPARHVPGPVRDRRPLRPPFHGHPERSSARPLG